MQETKKHKADRENNQTREMARRTYWHSGAGAWVYYVTERTYWDGYHDWTGYYHNTGRGRYGQAYRVCYA